MNNGDTENWVHSQRWPRDIYPVLDRYLEDFTRLDFSSTNRLKFFTESVFALFRVHVRHGPFDIRRGGGWDILEKNFLALILTKKISLLNGTVKKIICLQ